MAHVTNFNPNDYKKGNIVQDLHAQKLINRMNIQPTDRILDIGCGDGKIPFYLSKLVNQDGMVLGIDISPEMILSAIKDYTPQTNNLGFMIMDGQKLFFQEQFDIIVSFNALHWMPHQFEVLKGIRNALTPNGRVYLDVLRKSIFDKSYQKLQQNSKWTKFLPNSSFLPPHKHYTLDEYSTLLSNAGLEATITEDIKPLIFASKEHLKKFVQALPSPITIPINLKAEWIEDLTSEMAEEGLSFDVHRFFIQGKRNRHQ